MICGNCHNVAAHIYSSSRGEHCEHCGRIPTTSGTKTDGILARTSWRIRRQQSRHEGDMVLPHTYDKTSHRQKVNPDFLKLYPNQVKQFFSTEELERDGYRDMPKHIAKNTERRERIKAKVKNDTIFAGSTRVGIEKYLEETDPTL